MTPYFSRLMLGSIMFIGIALAACDAPAEQGESSLPESAATATTSSVEAPVSLVEQDVDEAVQEEAPYSDVPPPSRDMFIDAECNYEEWVNKPVNEQAIKDTGRMYRIMAPGSPMTMDHNPDRINVEHENGTVTRVWCAVELKNRR